ncbi:MAG: germination protein YpeB [Clostridia bacterium]|nr:germination protein YpeB [Clostridia bacterium]
MSRRNLVRVVSFSLSFALACGIFAFKTNKENKKYILQIENSYSYMLDELNTAANNIATILNKARFATTKPQLSSMASKLLTEAEISKNSLSQLPVSAQLSTLNRFFSQVGNFAYSVSENVSEETPISAKDTVNIEMLSSISAQISEILNTARDDYNNLDYWASVIESGVEEIVSEKDLNACLGELEGELKDYPTLIYDGPYSDHILEKEPTLLKDTAEVSKDDALLIAAKWSGISPDSLDFGGTTEGKIATYDFLSEGVYVSITKKGGHILSLRKERLIKDIILNYEHALLKAIAFLDRMEMPNLKETYYFEADGVYTINFAFLDGKTLCYTDLVKVGIAADNGEIVFYEAGGYIANHRSRAFETPKITEEEAQSIISPKLTVNSVRLALIPLNSLEEKRCYEFACTSADGQEILVYINTAALLEEEILVLQKSDGGILVK